MGSPHLTAAEHAGKSFSSNASYLAALVFLLHDTLLTLPAEVEHIWSKPCACVTKWLYLSARYLGLFALLGLQFTNTSFGAHLGVSQQPYCVPAYVAQLVALQVVIALMEAVLALRVYALYNQSRVVACVLGGLFVAEQVVMSVSLGRSANGYDFDEFCTAVTAPGGVIYFGVAPVAYELLLLAFTGWKCVIGARRAGWSRAPLLALLLRDGLWAFLLVFLTFVLNGVVSLASQGHAHGALLWPWQYVACTFAATRVILNMHTDPLASASMNGRRRRRRVIRESTTRVRGGKDGESGWQGKLGENEVGFALTTVMRGPEETSMCVDVVGRGRWDERDRRGAEG